MTSSSNWFKPSSTVLVAFSNSITAAVSTGVSVVSSAYSLPPQAVIMKAIAVPKIILFIVIFLSNVQNNLNAKHKFIIMGKIFLQKHLNNC